jgi:5-hydroxyisourate hydrolase
MGLSTHVLDTMHGCPAAGMAVTLSTMAQGMPTIVKCFTLNFDGRNPDGLLYDNAALGIVLPEPAFLDVVQLDFGIAHTDQHYHVPLLCTPWSYSTYRGS